VRDVRVHWRRSGFQVLRTVPGLYGRGFYGPRVLGRGFTDELAFVDRGGRWVRMGAAVLSKVALIAAASGRRRPASRAADRGFHGAIVAQLDGGLVAHGGAVVAQMDWRTPLSSHLVFFSPVHLLFPCLGGWVGCLPWPVGGGLPTEAVGWASTEDGGDPQRWRGGAGGISWGWWGPAHRRGGRDHRVRGGGGNPFKVPAPNFEKIEKERKKREGGEKEKKTGLAGPNPRPSPLFHFLEGSCGRCRSFYVVRYGGGRENRTGKRAGAAGGKRLGGA